MTASPLCFRTLLFAAATFAAIGPAPVAAQTVGVTAGASTPKWLIDEVMERIQEINRDKKY